jgi:hypothetical protein
VEFLKSRERLEIMRLLTEMNWKSESREQAERNGLYISLTEEMILSRFRPEEREIIFSYEMMKLEDTKQRRELQEERRNAKHEREMTGK